MHLSFMTHMVFPLDLNRRKFLKKKGFGVDEEVFKEAMEVQRKKSP